MLVDRRTTGAAVRPWSNPQTVAVLWLIAAVLVVAWVGGLVSEYRERQQWSQIRKQPAVHEKCPAFERGAYCQ